MNVLWGLLGAVAIIAIAFLFSEKKSNIKIRCKEYLSGTIVEEFDNGDFLYEIDVPENEHFWFGTVLALGAQVKVIEPPGLIDRICMNCNEILKQYEEV